MTKVGTTVGEALPIEILAPLQDARNVWKRHGYPISPHGMQDIDLALDSLNIYLDVMKEINKVYGHESSL